MFFRCSRLGKVNSKLSFYRLIHKYIFKMEKAYLRHVDSGDQFELALKYSNEQLKVNRQFNFSRKLTESVESFTSRVATNLEKVMNKKIRKKDKINKEVGINKLTVSLLLNNIEVSKDVTCENIFQPGNNITLKVMDKEYDVIVNSPWVDNLSLPMSMLAGFPTYPSKFEVVFTNKEISEFIWSKSLDEKNWTVVGNDYIYEPSNEDINHYLKLTCIPKNEQFEGPTVECVSVCKVEANPGQCPFELRHQFTKERTKENE